MERYERYKDSGVKWIGEIPGHWECEKAKRHFQSRKQIVGRNSSQYERLALTLKGVIKRFEGDGVGLNPEKLDTYQIVDKDDLIFKLIDLENVSTSRVGLSPYKGIVSPAYIRISAVDEVNIRFAEYYYLNMWMRHIFNDLGTPGVRSNLSSTDLLNLPLLYPSIVEQKAIATYLDKATAKIDEAIAQQQKMIDLLNERKQIIINNAVTKGLNPDAPMKDSGVDWIGEIPEHWEVSRIKNVITLLTDYDANGSFSDIAKNCNINNGTPYAWMVRTTDLVNNRVGIVEGNNYCDKKTYDYLAKSSLESGDLLMTKRGNVGMVYVVPECSCPMTLAPNLYLLKTKASDINNRYLMHYLSSTKPKSQLAILNKSTTLGALYKDDVKSLQIVLPPIDEQLLLAQFIDKELDKVDSVISNCNRQISLLQERKQIIINDVVTGKVKVS